MFEISSEINFSAAHHLREYCGSCENVHGHNWLVRATVRAEQLNSIGLAIDFKILKKHIKSVTDKLDHSDLNSIFTQGYGNPSSENIAKYIYHEFAKSVKQEYPQIYVHRIDVWETPGNCASYFE
ncbi:MAG: 6-carboxytetrahydropterin synthase QueD [Chitinispirillales bacterium]|jgi:6-pyruvoyltetrahydropterin/6-carboxytetrahydropterin synthase|nr:6-carboxytetrahydropterin synthase QueD [Chitinispirillales bacterium]